MNPIQCPLCTSNRLGAFLEVEALKLLCCEGCGLVFQPAPALVEFQQAEVRYDAVNLAHRRAIRAELLRIAQDRLAWVKRFVPGSAQLLEVGGGTGEFSFVAKQHGWQVTLLEISAPFAAEAQQHYGLKVRRELLSNSSFPAGSFDLIALFHVLEHLPQPEDFLPLVASLLAPGGSLALIVPNLNALTDRLYGRQALSLNQPDHLFHYTPKTLQRLLEKSGFSLIDLRTVEANYHLWTSVYGTLGRFRRTRTRSVENKAQATRQSATKWPARVPYLVGRLTAPLTWPYRRWVEVNGQGHEIYCLARPR